MRPPRERPAGTGNAARQAGHRAGPGAARSGRAAAAMRRRVAPVVDEQLGRAERVAASAAKLPAQAQQDRPGRRRRRARSARQRTRPSSSRGILDPGPDPPRVCSPRHEAPRHRRRRLHRQRRRRAAARARATTSPSSTASPAGTGPPSRTAAASSRSTCSTRRGHRRAVGQGFDGVLHFAALALVGRVRRPPRALPPRQRRRHAEPARRDARRTASSASSSPPPARPTASRRTVPIHEDVPTAPVNSYGNSKLAVDRMIADECRAHGLGAISLRYFNVAGASGPLRARTTSPRRT